MRLVAAFRSIVAWLDGGPATPSLPACGINSTDSTAVQNLPSCCRDCDPFSLRMELPGAVPSEIHAIDPGAFLAGTLTPSRCAWSCRVLWPRWLRMRRPTAAQPTCTAPVRAVLRCPVPCCAVCAVILWQYLLQGATFGNMCMPTIDPMHRRAVQGESRHACSLSCLPPFEPLPPTCCSILPLACHLLFPAAAGLGRAPATALAWMWWFKGWHLEDAYEHLTSAEKHMRALAARAWMMVL